VVHELRFDGQVAIVTGAGRGVGRSHALLLAERGAAVVVNDLGTDVFGAGSSSGPAQEVATEIHNNGGRAIANMSDVASQEGANALFNAAIEEFGRVDILVHNAGINIGALEPLLGVHVRAAWWLAELAWSEMINRNYGRIVLTSSASGMFGDGTGPEANPKQAYATAKAAVVGLTKSLAMRGAPVGIKVNAIQPKADTRLVELNRSLISTRVGSPLPASTIDWGKRNAPARLAAAGTLWLMHESCPVSGCQFVVGAGRVSEVIIGATRGFVAPDGNLRPEDPLEHLDEIRDRGGMYFPLDMYDHSEWVTTIVPDGSQSL
jgi:NAD(P)-dependent dehydrogenase (short-subunit alcohol dehydrogenase family)